MYFFQIYIKSQKFYLDSLKNTLTSRCKIIWLEFGGCYGYLLLLGQCRFGVNSAWLRVNLFAQTEL